jgi:hypothetical protein
MACLPLVSSASAAALTLMDQQPPAIGITTPSPPPLDDDASSAPPSPCSVVSDCSTADLDGFPDSAASAPALDDLLPVADTAQQQRVTAARSVFALDCVPRWGLQSVCGRRPEMEDAALVLPRFFQLPLWMVAGDAAVDGLDRASFRLPAHLFAVFDGHGGVQVPLLSCLYPHTYERRVSTNQEFHRFRLPITAARGSIPYSPRSWAEQRTRALSTPRSNGRVPLWTASLVLTQRWEAIHQLHPNLSHQTPSAQQR